MRIARILSAVFVFALVSPLWAATEFVVNMDGSQEVGTLNNPVNATGQGALTLVDLGGGNFRWEYEVTVSPELNFSNVTGNAALDNGGRQATGIHIHNAARGVNGPIIYGLYGPDQDFDNDVVAVLNADNSTTFTGSWGPTDGNPVGNINGHATNFLLPAVAGEDVPFYFNAHTQLNPGGETRGQIVAVPEPTAWLLCILGGVPLIYRRKQRR
jgi:hypothetical protein